MHGLCRSPGPLPFTSMAVLMPSAGPICGNGTQKFRPFNLKHFCMIALQTPFSPTHVPMFILILFPVKHPIVHLVISFRHTVILPRTLLVARSVPSQQGAALPQHLPFSASKFDCSVAKFDFTSLIPGRHRTRRTAPFGPDQGGSQRVRRRNPP